MQKIISGSIDNSSSKALRPATCSQDPEILLNTQHYCAEIDRSRSREQVTGRRHLHCLQFLCFIVFGFTLAGCVSVPPKDVNNICQIFREYPRWYIHTLDVQRRWRVPVAVQMAIIHQESKFDAKAKPPRTKLFWFIPWSRPSTAYGYAQVLDGTWDLYKKSNGGFFSSRDDFADGVDFIGWYANQAHRRAGIPRDNAYELYLAYHEGITGYMRKTYLQKKWLIPVAHKVSARAQIYRAQLAKCHKY